MIDTNAKVLLLYTGGTIGMVENSETGLLEPFNFDHLSSHLPEIKRFKFQVDHIVFTPTIDSSEIIPEHWVQMVKIVEQNYDKYDGFVVLHGTDTMAYTASVMSFMIENIKKPIVLTGSQLPIGKLRTDAKENLITALEIAANKDTDGNPMVPEVCIYFQTNLIRGNRSSKVNAENFNAFRSPNYPNLGKAGIHIKYDSKTILKPNHSQKTIFHYKIDGTVAVLKLFPGINKETIEAILNISGLQAVVIETFGAGNAPMIPWFLELLENAVKKGIVLVNITQCQKGSVDMSLYETGQELLKCGVVSGYDATLEATIAKLLVLIGHNYNNDEIKRRIQQSLAGEITYPEE